MEIFKNLFSNHLKLVPLQKRGNISNEVIEQSEKLTIENRLIRTIELSDEKILLYRLLFDIPESEETSIMLRLRIISPKGVYFPEPKLDAFFMLDEFSRQINLADIVINESLSGKGYGSILIEELISIAVNNNINRINGWISKEDVGHLDKLKYFYNKNGFYVNIYPRYDEVNSNKIGEISWINES